MRFQQNYVFVIDPFFVQELLGMDKAGSYSETTGGQGGGGYNQEDKYEKEKRVRAKNTAPRYKI